MKVQFTLYLSIYLFFCFKLMGEITNFNKNKIEISTFEINKI